MLIPKHVQHLSRWYDVLNIHSKIQAKFIINNYTIFRAQFHSNNFCSFAEFGRNERQLRIKRSFRADALCSLQQQNISYKGAASLKVHKRLLLFAKHFLFIQKHATLFDSQQHLLTSNRSVYFISTDREKNHPRTARLMHHDMKNPKVSCSVFVSLSNEFSL